MDDPDLEAIRKQRLAQLQAGYQVMAFYRYVFKFLQSEH